MKTIDFWSLIFILIVCGCNNGNKSPIQGAWQLVHEDHISGGKITDEFPINITGGEIKMWSEHNFVFVGRFKQDSIFTDSYGGGTYILEGNRYEERVQFHSAPEYLGQKVKILLEIKNDTIIQTYPVDDYGQVNKNEYYIEKWIRLK
jgi:hypothetical protein